MKLTFQSKEESNQLQRDAFLKLSKSERVFAFYRLMERVKQFPVKNKKEKENVNFVIILKANWFKDLQDE